MKSSVSVVALLGCFLCGCTAVELDSLVPSSVLDYYATPDDYPVIKTCSLSHLSTPNEAKVFAAVVRVHAILPSELKNDAVVNHVLLHAQYVHANAQAAAKSLLKPGSNVETSVAVPKPASTLTHLDIDRFAKVVSNQVLRHTPATTPSGPNNVDPFWQKLRAYYIAYYGGKFNTYFGETLDKPKVSLTISDTEIVQAATVFIELLMDEIFESPIWIGPDKSYYPGGNANTPTSLKVSNITPPTIPAGPSGCGMNVAKADAMRYLAQAFSKAASTETGLTVKSAGSLEVGLGIVGKLSIGDNSLLTALVQGVVSEIVARLTVQIAAPILEAIDFEKQTALAQASSATVHAGSKTVNLRALPRMQVSRIMTSLFVSGKPMTM